MNNKLSTDFRINQNLFEICMILMNIFKLSLLYSSRDIYFEPNEPHKMEISLLALENRLASILLSWRKCSARPFEPFQTKNWQHPETIWYIDCKTFLTWTFRCVVCAISPHAYFGLKCYPNIQVEVQAKKLSIMIITMRAT